MLGQGWRAVAVISTSAKRNCIALGLMGKPLSRTVQKHDSARQLTHSPRLTATILWQLIRSAATIRFFCPGFAFGNGTPFNGSRFCYPGIGFGYYAPFYSYGCDSSPDYGYLTLSPLYSEGYSSPPDQGHSPKVNLKTNCADSWTETRRDDSLGSAIRSAFQIQCENTHAASESNSPQESLD